MIKIKKKILYVFGGEEASGAEMVIERLIEYNENFVDAFLFVSPGKFADDIAKKNICATIQLDHLKKLNRSQTSGLNFYYKALLNYFSISWAVLKFINKYKIGVVHANTVVPASYLLPAILWAKLFRPKVRWIWSDHDLSYFTKLDHILSRLCTRFFDRTLTVSDAVKRKYNPSKKIITFYNGLDTNIFKADDDLRKNQRDKFGLYNNELVFTIAATISPRKGQLSLIESFAELIKVYPQIKLFIAGGNAIDTPEYTQKVFDKAQLYKSNVHILGKVTDMLALYNASDVIINNSNMAGSEPLGTTIYEAMACEKVVLVSDTGGNREIVDEKINGFIFKADDIKCLKNAMEYVLLNDKHMAAIRLASRQKVIHKFNIVNMVNCYNDIIKNFIK